MAELSVIIIGRNEAAHIEGCLRSVFASLEGLHDYEVIYVDSASVDDSVSIAGKFPVRILQLRPEWKLTPSAGRYIGYQHASGRYLAFIDGDTVLDAGWLRASQRFLQENPEYGGVAGILDKACLSRDGETTVIARNHYEQSADRSVMTVGSLGGIATYRREAMERAGTFNPFLPTGEECEVALRIRRAGYKLARIYAPMCVAHTLPPESIGEIMRRSRAHLYDYGATLRYCLINGFGRRFLIEQMRFVCTFVLGVLGFAVAAIVGVMTGTAWLLGGAIAIALLYAGMKQRRGKNMAISLLKRTVMTYRSILSFLSTRPVPVEFYPTDVVVVK